jgi:hypothetical protein
VRSALLPWQDDDVYLALVLVAQQATPRSPNSPRRSPLLLLAGNLREGGISVIRRLYKRRRACRADWPPTIVTYDLLPIGSIATTSPALLIPAMVKHGYPVGFAAALQASAAELGVIIPPSIPMILYGVAAEVSIGELFVAGFGPGFLIGGALVLTVWVWCRIKGYGRDDRADRVAVMAATRRALLALFMPVLILGGIYGGIFTPTEASIVRFLCLIASMFMGRWPATADAAAICCSSSRS